MVRNSGMFRHLSSITKKSELNDFTLAKKSDGLFSIKSIDESFNIITPNDGDILHRGTSTFIYWDNIDKKIDSVDIFYSLDKGKNWVLIKKNLDNLGKYNWAVPKDISSSNKCLIKISSSDNQELIDYSDKTFTIK